VTCVVAIYSSPRIVIACFPPYVVVHLALQLVAPHIVVGRFASLVIVHFALLVASCFALLYIVICLGCYSLLTCIVTI
jgi:hypothetical protein